MAARNNKNKNGNGKKKMGLGGLVWKVARELATPVSFLDQISKKDRQTMGDAFNNAPITQKLKIMTNIVLGRTMGINPFSDEVQAPQTINFGGMFNRWTGLGAGAIIYSFIAEAITINGKKILPHGGKLRQIGIRTLTGGAAGGIFDAPGDGSKPSQSKGTRNIQLDAAPNQTIFRNTEVNTGHGLVLQSNAARSSF